MKAKYIKPLCVDGYRFEEGKAACKATPDAVACVSGKNIGKATAAYVRRKQSKGL